MFVKILVVFRLDDTETVSRQQRLFVLLVQFSEESFILKAAATSCRLELTSANLLLLS